MIGACIKDEIPCDRYHKNEDLDLPFMCFLVSIVNRMSFVLAVYLPRDDGIAMFERIAEKIDGIFSVSPSVTIDSCGDFNIHHKVWLVH